MNFWVLAIKPRRQFMQESGGKWVACANGCTCTENINRHTHYPEYSPQSSDGFGRWWHSAYLFEATGTGSLAGSSPPTCFLMIAACIDSRSVSRKVCASKRPKRSIKRATTPVQPV